MDIPVVVILGPTGSGKTTLAIELARRLNGEIISQDSRQIYCYMDIGTAKPTPEERSAAPHHGLDLVSPNETWTLAQQQKLTRMHIDLLHSQGKVPLLVGGTGQYLRAIIEGWRVPEVPPQPKLRSHLAKIPVEELYERLSHLDPESAKKIMPRDARRIIRALEVFTVTGEKLSSQQGKERPPYDFRIYGLTLDRGQLYDRLDRRIETMLQRGLLDEIRSLIERGYVWELPALRSIGYGEFEPYFTADRSLAECLERLRYNTHDFARGQYVWFRRIENVEWIDVSGPPDVHELARKISEPRALS